MWAPLDARGQRTQPTIKVFIRDEFDAVDLVEGALARARPHASRPGRSGKRREARGDGTQFRTEPLAAEVSSISTSPCSGSRATLTTARRSL
jgi:hypothetical protein